ncbi:MAG TPA: WYL domain-containing protein [Phenylobacterium sp.]|nr:WYL domain-containing protein [Phenylobacterium sp.]
MPENPAMSVLRVAGSGEVGGVPFGAFAHLLPEDRRGADVRLEPPGLLDTVRDLRAALREERKVILDYRDEQGAVTRRTIWPVTVAYLDTVRLIGAWCELRQAFRSFRTDRVVAADFTSDRYSRPRRQLWAEWRKAHYSWTENPPPAQKV